MSLPALMSRKANISANEWSLEAAVDAFFQSGLKDGDLVSHQWLADVLDVPKPKSVGDVVPMQWVLLDRVEQFKLTLLKDHNIALANVRGQGYRIVPPAEQANHAVATTLRAVRKEFSKGGSLLEHTRMDALSNTERRRHLDAEVKMSGLESMVRKQRRDVLSLFK